MQKSIEVFMNRFLMALSTLLLSATSFATEDQPFSKACNVVTCTEKMKEIEAQFDHSQPLLPQEIPAVYSGECVHLSYYYDAEHIHYGMALFESNPANGKPYFTGIFGFFNPENPWKDWDIARAQKETASSRFHFQVKDYKTYSLVNTAEKYPNNLMLYWLTQDSTTKDIYIVAAWGIEQRVYCQLKRNALQ